MKSILSVCLVLGQIFCSSALFARPGFIPRMKLPEKLMGIISEQKRLTRVWANKGGGVHPTYGALFERNVHRGFDLAKEHGLIRDLPPPGTSFNLDEMRILALISGSRLKNYSRLARYDGRSLSALSEAGGMLPYAGASAGLPLRHTEWTTGTFVSASTKSIEHFKSRWARGLLQGEKRKNVYFAKDIWGFKASPLLLEEQEIITRGIPFENLTDMLRNAPIDKGPARQLIHEAITPGIIP